MMIKNTITGKTYSEDEFVKLFPKGCVIDCWGSVTDYEDIHSLLSDLNNAYYDSDEYENSDVCGKLVPKYILLLL